jgi:hypothetical protein
LLSELNPLQYLPVIGTLYRAITGDTIPEVVRDIGSVIVSGLIGGPVGIATNLAALGVEKATGIDPEQIGHGMLASLGVGTAGAVASPAPVTTFWSPSQLAAYGVTATANAVPADAQQASVVTAELRPIDARQGVGRG